MAGPAYDELNKAWKATARIVLGGDVGELADYDAWLGEFVEPVTMRKSSVSGNYVYFAGQHYRDGSRYISLDEVDFGKRFEPLGINEIKDIDSIAEALKERFSYCGNIVLANSKNVEKSSNINGSHHVYKSDNAYGCERIAYCSHVKNCKYIFTDNSDCGSSFLIRCLEGFESSRCFETWRTYGCSDCYFTFGVESSRDVMFSFNLKNARHAIGNLQLPSDKYSVLKEKLVAEVRCELMREKRLPSLIEMAGGRTACLPGGLSFEGAEAETDMAPIEEAFRKTTKVVLGRPLSGIGDYEPWLMEDIPSVHERKSVLSGRRVFQSGNLPLSALPHDRLVSEREGRELAALLRMDEQDITSLENVAGALWKIAFFVTEARLGDVRNVSESCLVNRSMNCYKGGVFNESEECACCFWPRNSKCMFGSQITVGSSHCIHAHNSANVTRAFEVDSCGSCSDIYFSHNCENVQDAMFCFNVKNLRNAIGNAQLAPDAFRRIKTSLLGQVAGRLERNKKLEMSIFSIGCR